MFLIGAQGVHASTVNGFWRATAERRQGRVVYVKVGDDSLCIEHFGGLWQIIKLVSDKGKYVAVAFKGDTKQESEFEITAGQRTLTRIVLP